MENKYPQRKKLRLNDFDYSQSGAYFVTICTKNKEKLFSLVGEDSLSSRLVERTFLETIQRYDGVESPIYVVMPNHFHAIINIYNNEREDKISSPTISDIIRAFKRYSTGEYIKLVKNGKLPPFDKQIWQRSFYDHVIRNQKDYDEIYKYIQDNPVKWEMDKLYVD
ncbi:MAG: transposase [Acutalibacteraceae bacterium]|nr:transposase [Acutalibacteraceae bacterium]